MITDIVQRTTGDNGVTQQPKTNNPLSHGLTAHSITGDKGGAPNPKLNTNTLGQYKLTLAP